MKQKFDTRKFRKNSELQVRIAVTTFRVLEVRMLTFSIMCDHFDSVKILMFECHLFRFHANNFKS